MPSGMLYSVNLKMFKQSIGIKVCLIVTMKPVLSFDT